MSDEVAQSGVKALKQSGFDFRAFAKRSEYVLMESAWHGFGVFVGNAPVF